VRIDGLRLPRIVPRNIQQAVQSAPARPAAPATGASSFQSVGRASEPVAPGVSLPGDPAMMSLARGATFARSRVERGAQLGGVAKPAAREASAAAGASAPGGPRDITTSDPRYGRYLRDWLNTGADARPGEQLLQLFQSRLGQLKEAVRSARGRSS
jgi:hypothetical protein